MYTALVLKKSKCYLFNPLRSHHAGSEGGSGGQQMMLELLNKVVSAKAEW